MFQNQLMQRLGLFPTLSKYIHTTSIVERLRPGTRAKKEAKKKAMKLKKASQVKTTTQYIPYKMKLEMEKVGKVSPRLICPEFLIQPTDNVYFANDYIWNRHTVAEAVEMHRETHHPTQFNNANEKVVAFIELSMTTNKKKTFIEAFHNVLLLPHLFDNPHDRTILAVCKDEESAQNAKNAGATLAVGPELFRMAKTGDIDFKDYEHIVCHNSLLPEFVAYRTLIRKKMPSVTNGTAGPNIVSLVERFTNGFQYIVVKDKYDHDYASIEVNIGTLEMSSKGLETNLEIILKDVEAHSKFRTEGLITKVVLKCHPTHEKIIIDHDKFFPKELQDEVEVDER